MSSRYEDNDYPRGFARQYRQEAPFAAPRVFSEQQPGPIRHHRSRFIGNAFCFVSLGGVSPLL